MATAAFAPPLNHPQYQMNSSAGPSPPETYQHGKNTYAYGPMSQTPPSNNTSPTNYHSNLNVRQIRQPRVPLYVPAALRPSEKLARPTDIPGRRAPDTPPTSKDSSFDSARTDSSTAVEFAGMPFGQQTDTNDLESIHRGLSRAASENYAEEELGEVTGAPTNAHWKPDESASACYICKESFTWFYRRHHCRRCGNLVCADHIKYQVPLDQNARYHPQGTTSKACKQCWEGWKALEKLHHSRTGSIAESSNSSQGTAMPIPNLPKQTDDVRIGSMARSEGGMVWSTF